MIRRNDVEAFKKLLRSNNVDGYGKQVKMLLEGIMGEADAVTNKRIAHVNRRPGNRRFDVRRHVSYYSLSTIFPLFFL